MSRDVPPKEHPKSTSIPKVILFGSVICVVIAFLASFAYRNTNDIGEVISSEEKSLEEILNLLNSSDLEEIFYAKKILKPLITVIIPYYNAHEWLNETLQSLYGQTFQDFEIILVDDCSTNPQSIKELELLKKNFVEIRKKRFYIRIVHHLKNKRLAGARNTGVKKARGRFILFLDPDDLLDKTALEKLAFVGTELISNQPKETFFSIKIGYIYPGVEHFGIKQDIVLSEFNKNRLIKENFLTSCALIDREIYLENGGMCESIKYFEDYDFWLRLASNNYIGKLLKEPLFKYRRHNFGLSAQVNLNVPMEEYMAEVRKNNPIIFGDLPPHHQLSNHLPCYKTLDHENDIQVIKNYSQTLLETPFPYFPEGFKNRLNYISLLDYSFFSYGKEFFSRQGNSTIKKWSILYIIPWMVMGGADLYDLHILNALKESGFYHITLITVIETDHVWKKKFSEQVDEIFSLPQLTSNIKARTEKLLDHLVISRNIDIIVTRSTNVGYQFFEKNRKIYQDIRFVDILHLVESENPKENSQLGWEIFSKDYHQYLDKRIVASHHLLGYLKETQNLSTEKVKVLYPAVETTFCHPYPLPDNLKTFLDPNSKTQKLVLFIGRFEEQKDPLLWVKVALKILTKDSLIKFVMIGEGWMKKYAEHHISKELKSNSFFFPSLIDHDEVFKYLSASHALLVTSTYEGVPIVILEAICMGVPIISTQVGGINELLENSKFGKSIPRKDIPEDELISLLAMETLTTLQKRNNETEKQLWLKHCKNKYDLKIFQQTILDEFSSLISTINQEQKLQLNQRRILEQFVKSEK